ncbi:unannotated protein [freshwater metagenome]|uniref:Unannotated protein n=1 Tax=freshwater metagenome TaxID=449393 RepID=A0A6J7BSI8_9ZZZZ|nr:hypothetical protein [Actinomycetota bacterium]MSW37293.1 hypothetical protein [Actinomycetota bacterium]MSX38039.1 hypothetical protein [Actinomycetota bacterium]
MSNDDEFDRLLREVDASLGGGSTAGAPVSRSPGPVSRTRASEGQVVTAESRGPMASGLRTGVLSGLACGAGVTVLTAIFAWLPFIDNPISSGMGAFVGAFLTGTVLGVRRAGRRNA